MSRSEWALCRILSSEPSVSSPMAMRMIPTPFSTCSVSVVSNFTQTSGAIKVGIVGAGQLARMMGECAHDVGVRATVLALTPNDAAVATCHEVVIGEPTDVRALERLAQA